MREAYEESALRVRVEERPWTAYSARRAGRPMLVVVYRAVPLAGTLATSVEHDAAEWMDADTFASRSSIAPLARAVRSALAAPEP